MTLSEILLLLIATVLAVLYLRVAFERAVEARIRQMLVDADADNDQVDDEPSSTHILSLSGPSGPLGGIPADEHTNAAIEHLAGLRMAKLRCEIEREIAHIEKDLEIDPKDRWRG